MVKGLIKFLKTVKETIGVDTVAYASDGTVLYASSDFYAGLPYVAAEKDVLRPSDAPVTLLPLKGGVTVVLAGDGEEYRNYAELIRAATEGDFFHSKHELTLQEKLRLYLLGHLDADSVKELTEQYAGPFDCYVMTLVTDSVSKLGELKNFLDTMREHGDLIVAYDDKAVAFIKKCGEDDDYRSATDFALTLYDNIKEELRINFVINVGGTVHGFGELKEYFDRCALAYSFGKLMSPGDKVYSYKEYVMVNMLSEVSAQSRQKYLDTLLGGERAEILDDSELMTTAEEFLKNSLNISETSRCMYMHRNTLIYRLDKIEKATGLNLRHFNDAVAFRILTVLDKLVKNKK